jgi:2-polyprenyl-6-methoxyphenol hydroxylase-like FAD-dependent oxidoreductase
MQSDASNGATGKNKGRFIVIGAGYPGLATSIELVRKGFSVEVFESVKELTKQGQDFSLLSF